MAATTENIAGGQAGGRWHRPPDCRRDELWVLCDLFVAPHAQGAGVGGLLLRQAVAYGKGLPAGIICSTADPRAIRSYARLPGFQVHPTLMARGTNDRSRLGSTNGVREGTAGDLELAAHLDRTIRRGAHGADLKHLLSRGHAIRGCRTRTVKTTRTS